MDTPAKQQRSWSEVTTRIERIRPAQPSVHKDGDWSTLESVTVTVIRSGSADTMPQQE